MIKVVFCCVSCLHSAPPCSWTLSHSDSGSVFPSPELSPSQCSSPELFSRGRWCAAAERRKHGSFKTKTAVYGGFGWVGCYLQAGEEVGQLNEEGQKDEPDEADLRRRFGYLVSVHEGGHRETFKLLHVTLEQKHWTENWTVTSSPAASDRIVFRF